MYTTFSDFHNNQPKTKNEVELLLFAGTVYRSDSTILIFFMSNFSLES